MKYADKYRALQHEVARLAMACHRDPADITIVVASKTHPAEAVQEVYNAGCRLFGESRVQEASEKMTQCPTDIQWHLIGSLQRKKVPKVIGNFVLIHSVDSVELAQAISKASQDKGIVTHILLEANTSGEASKHGLLPNEWLELAEVLIKLPGIDIQGFMTMAPFTDNTTVIRKCFRALRELKEQFEARLGRHLPHLSMGMTHDYPIAVEEGATLLRIGSAVFSDC